MPTLPWIKRTLQPSENPRRLGSKSNESPFPSGICQRKTGVVLITTMDDDIHSHVQLLEWEADLNIRELELALPFIRAIHGYYLAIGLSYCTVKSHLPLYYSQFSQGFTKHTWKDTDLRKLWSSAPRTLQLQTFCYMAIHSNSQNYNFVHILLFTIVTLKTIILCNHT